MTTYGTYQRFEYQTANLEPLKKLAVNIAKIMFAMLVIALMSIVAVAVFQMIVIAANIVVAWFVVHGWQIAVTLAVFTAAWKVKP